MQCSLSPWQKSRRSAKRLSDDRGLVEYATDTAVKYYGQLDGDPWINLRGHTILSISIDTKGGNKFQKHIVTQTANWCLGQLMHESKKSTLIFIYAISKM